MLVIGPAWHRYQLDQVTVTLSQLGLILPSSQHIEENSSIIFFHLCDTAVIRFFCVCLWFMERL